MNSIKMSQEEFDIQNRLTAMETHVKVSSAWIRPLCILILAGMLGIVTLMFDMNRNLAELTGTVIQMNSRLDGLDQRMDRVELQLTENSKRLDENSKRLDRVELQLTENSKRLDENSKRLDTLQTYVLNIQN